MEYHIEENDLEVEKMIKAGEALYQYNKGKCVYTNFSVHYMKKLMRQANKLALAEATPEEQKQLKILKKNDRTYKLAKIPATLLATLAVSIPLIAGAVAGSIVGATVGGGAIVEGTGLGLMVGGAAGCGILLLQNALKDKAYQKGDGAWRGYELTGTEKMVNIHDKWINIGNILAANEIPLSKLMSKQNKNNAELWDIQKNILERIAKREKSQQTSAEPIK